MTQAATDVLGVAREQVLERGVLVPPLVGVVHRAVQGFFERTGK